MSAEHQPLALPLTLRYRPNPAEQLEAARAYRRTTRKFIAYRVVSVLAVGVAIWSIFLSDGAEVMALIWLALAAFTWFDPLPLLLTWISARGGASAPPYTAVFDDQAVTFDVGGQKIRRAWERYSRLIETPTLLVLVYGSWAYSIVPRRAIGDADAQARLVAFLSGRLRR